MNSVKKQKERTLKDELPRSVGAQYATGDQWRNNSRKNEGLGEFRELVIDREACVLRFLGLQRVRHN